MKKICIPIIFLVLVAACGIAFALNTKTAYPGQPLYSDGVVVQNNTATAPMKAAALTGTAIKTHGGTIATFNLYSSGRWFSKADWCVTKSDGTPVTVKRILGNNTAYMPGNCGSIAVNREYTTASLAAFSNTSTTVANGTYVWTVDRN